MDSHSQKFELKVLYFLIFSLAFFTSVSCNKNKPWENKATSDSSSMKYSAEIESLKSQAERGDFQAQADLAEKFRTGDGVAVNHFEALKWAKLSSAGGNALGDFIVGKMYSRGEGVVSKDYAEAASWYRKAAEKGLDRAQFELGVYYFEGMGVPKDYTEAIKWYRKAAKQNYGKALFNLGHMYLQGFGVPQNYREAFLLFQNAAQQGINIAFGQLGAMYEEGWGVDQNLVTASDYYLKAAKLGDSTSQFNLGLMYYHGKGVQKDLIASFAWLYLSSSNGNMDAERNLRAFSSQMLPSDIEKAKNLAREWNTTSGVSRN